MIVRLFQRGPETAVPIQRLRRDVPALCDYSDARYTFPCEPVQRAVHHRRPETLPLKGRADGYQADAAFRVRIQMTGNVSGWLTSIGDEDGVRESGTAIPDPRLVQVVTSIVRELTIEIETGISVTDPRYRGEGRQIGVTPFADPGRHTSIRPNLTRKGQTNID